jgi:hypothetical protein
MMSKGTERLKPGGPLRIAAKNGGEENALASGNCTAHSRLRPNASRMC